MPFVLFRASRDCNLFSRGVCPRQVQEQIRQREVDMKTQLALMKNTIAFSLYIDETLQIDLTDPQTTSLMQAITPSGHYYVIAM